MQGGLYSDDQTNFDRRTSSGGLSKKAIRRALPQSGFVVGFMPLLQKGEEHQIFEGRKTVQSVCIKMENRHCFSKLNLLQLFLLVFAFAGCVELSASRFAHRTHAPSVHPPTLPLFSFMGD